MCLSMYCKLLSELIAKQKKPVNYTEELVAVVEKDQILYQRQAEGGSFDDNEQEDGILDHVDAKPISAKTSKSVPRRKLYGHVTSSSRQ